MRDSRSTLLYYPRWVGRYPEGPGTCSWLPLTGSRPVALPDDDRFTQMTSTSLSASIQPCPARCSREPRQGKGKIVSSRAAEQQPTYNLIEHKLPDSIVLDLSVYPAAARPLST